MKLSEVIIKNEKEGKVKTNHLIVKAKLRELVKNRSQELVDLLTALKIKASIVAPKAVLYSTLVKHLALNSELRAAVTGMLMEETSEYLNANGQGMTIAGAAMQALGGILTGIGRNQTMTATSATTMDEAKRKELEAERKRQEEEEERKRKTNLAIGITVGVLVILGIVIAIIHASKKNQLEAAAAAGSASVSALNG
ncbi:hypothetical protein [Parvicella tangerina]|uniref:Uncharacterized protein n=1 Tax=Parvicella tangerina TaxID=2829795 RepID=A0A916JM49_9FLAO|nr:hypothetical protein [Parvicella tangerina]CAG5082281.1 hypothetical protein CRYO30217_01864 [Parvicella tangerina]